MELRIVRGRERGIRTMVMEHTHTHTHLVMMITTSCCCSSIWWWHYWQRWRRSRLLLWWMRGTLALLLLIANPSSLSLRIPNLTKVKPNSTSTKRVSLRFPTILFKSSPESTNECIEAPPRLAQRTRTGCRWVRVTKEWTRLCVYLCLPKLV